MNQNWSKERIWLGLFSVLAIDSAIFTTNCALAQIVPDDTLGSESSTTRPDPRFPIDIIDSGATRGANLFHSFSEFNVGEGQGAYFYSPSADIQNILTRVTGSNPSTILGTVGTFGNSIPNLFLINPNGIIFGPSASLDIGNSGLNVGGTGGSFVATTANAVLLGDGGIFSATNPAASNLLSVNPSALFFNGTSSAQIVDRATDSTSAVGAPTFGIQVPFGRSLLLVGSNVRLDSGKLLSPGGRVELGGVAAGTVGLNINDNSLSLDYPAQVQRADIVITNSSNINVTGSGGNIALNARNIDILEQSILTGGLVTGQGSVDAQAGDINLNATGTISVVGNNNSSSGILNTLGSGALGRSGDINITANSLSLNGAVLGINSSGQGDAGSIYIQATDSVSLANSNISSTVLSSGVGKAGTIDIQANSLFLTDNSVLSTSTLGQGDAGNVFIRATDSVSLANSSRIANRVLSSGVGKAGTIDIQANSLLLTDDSFLSTATEGQGDAGSIFIQAIDSVSLASGSDIDSIVSSSGVGKAGTIDIQANSLFLDGSVLNTSTEGQGDAGNVFIRATDSVSLANSSRISNRVLSSGVGKAGTIDIQANSLFLTDNSVLSTSTLGQGDGGNVFIQATDSVSLANSSRISNSVLFSGVGKAGTIDIQANSLLLTDDSFLSTATEGQGDAGSISIEATNSVSLANSSINSAVSSSGVGKAGTIDIQANSLSLTDDSVLSTGIEGQGDAGNISIQATDSVSLADSSIDSAVFSSGVGKGGTIYIQANSLFLTDGSVLGTSTAGQGDAGNVFIQATGSVLLATGRIISNVQPGGVGNAGNIFINASDTVELSGVFNNGLSSALTTSTNRGASGRAGNITVNTTNFRIADGAVVSALTANSSNAGNITIKAKNFAATGGGQVLTSTSSSGRAGSITLNVTDKITLSGTDPTFAARLAQFGAVRVTNQSSASGIFANTAPGSTGDGGSIFIDPIEFNISDGARVSVSSLGQGNGGNLQIQARNLTLNRDGAIEATTASGEGGNISISAQDLLLLRRSSNISSKAGGSGNGGNIDINTTFIVAQPREDSNIIADAIEGRGGNIKITTQGIFGIQSRPEQTSQSDITASSELGIDGTIDLNTPDVDPAQGLVALPVDTVDASSQIAAGCTNSNASVASNKFTVTGRGGLPPNPGDTLSGEEVLTDWATLAESEAKNPQPATTSSSRINSPTPQVVEAQGWVIDARGKVILTAQAPDVTPNSNRFSTSACQKSPANAIAHEN